MVTAESKTENVIAARKAGVNNYIVKPFNAQTLKAKIEAVFAKNEAKNDIKNDAHGGVISSLRALGGSPYQPAHHRLRRHAGGRKHRVQA
jgi:DNA-binding response OmpR family regulator